MSSGPAFEEEQRWLGVVARIQRRPQRHLRHLPRLREHQAALEVGFAEPGHLLPQRLARLRARLWRSPLWMDWLRRHALSPDELTGLESLAHFPLADRELLGSRWAEAPALGLEPEVEAELHFAISSGSTGKALKVARDGYDALHPWAVLHFWLARAGVVLPPRPRVALLCALPSGLAYSVRLPHFANGALHRISTARANPIPKLEKADPAVLFSDPAGFHWLSAQQVRLRPKLLLSSAQHLPAAQRRLLTGRLGAPLVNYYATTEAGPIAWECLTAQGVFHTLQPDCHVESVAGELVVTRLRDSALPLLRCRTGDAGLVQDGTCPCGFRGRSIVGFAGRRACDFLRGDGQPVDAWNLVWLFKDLHLVGFRMTQLAPEQFELLLDAAPPVPPPLLEARLQVALRRLGWVAPRVQTRVVDKLDHPLKPEPFVCRVSRRR